jgi:hypothetical protein
VVDTAVGTVPGSGPAAHNALESDLEVVIAPGSGLGSDTALA